MAFAVSTGSGYSKFTVRFATAQEAMVKANDIIEHDDAQNVVVTVAQTGQTYTVEEFAALLSQAAPS